MKKHKKHTNLERRNNAVFAPNEIAILGSSCNVISELVHKVSKKLTNYNLAYLDASHAKNATKNKLSEFVFHSVGTLQIATGGLLNKFQQRIDFSQFDYLFINGNHYQSTNQILILDEAKEAAVLKRIAQLNSIQFVVKLKNNTNFFNFLVEKYPEIINLPCYTIDQVEEISNHISTLIQDKIAPVKGLVLVGGKSTRMGKDKAALLYFGKPQKQVAKELLENSNVKTYYSVEKVSENSDEISDKFLNLGPFGGICSAFQKDPNSAWLVLATDVPFINNHILSKLLKNRNPSKVATAIKGKGQEFPEPLITIYEPKAYPILLQYLAQGYSCPRKMLINSEVEIIEIEDAFIRNINTPADYEMAKKELQNKK